MELRYFDHAASSWPKPEAVIEAVDFAMRQLGGNPNRGAHTLSLRTSRAVFEARSSCAKLLGVASAENLMFVPSCTYGCNLVLKGLLKPGDRVVVGSMEHNAVVRPLASLAKLGVEVEVVQADSTGFVDPDDVEKAVAAAPTRAVVCQHASNVTGVIQPVGDLTDIAHEHGALMIVDGSQAGGHLHVDLTVLRADAYLLSGHKGLLGPQGIGLMYLGLAADPDPLVEGGTGGFSAEDEIMPAQRPDRYEAGTLNTPGILGLGAGARFLLVEGQALRKVELQLTFRLMEELSAISGVRVLGPALGVERVPVVSVVHEAVDAERIAFRLDREADIACRPGLHCSPWAHRTIGTLESGTLRFSIGAGIGIEDVEYLVRSFETALR